MPHRKVAELATKFQSADTFDEFATCWLRNRADMGNCTVVFSLNDVGTEFPIEAAIGAYDGEKFFLRSIYSRPKIYFMNESILLSMQGNGRVEVPIDSVLALDTQFGRYAVNYVNDRSFVQCELGQSVHNLIGYIYKNGITFDYSFYICENFANYLAGKADEIQSQLVALVTLAEADRAEFLSSGKFILPYDEDGLARKVSDLLDSYRNRASREALAKDELLQARIASLLAKSVLLKNAPISPKDKVSKLVEFMDRDLSCVLQREFVFCAKWLLGQNIPFFDPVNAGPGYAQAPQKIHGMAWDLMFLRHMEKYSSKTVTGKYTIGYFASFDRRLIQVSDLFKSKGCLYVPANLLGRYFMLNEEEFLPWITSVIGPEQTQAVFNDQAWKRRDDSRPFPEEVFAMRRVLEQMVMKALKPSRKQ